MQDAFSAPDVQHRASDRTQHVLDLRARQLDGRTGEEARIAADGPITARIRHMLAAADKRIALMARLTLYRQDGVDLEAEAQAEPAPLAA